MQNRRWARNAEPSRLPLSKSTTVSSEKGPNIQCFVEALSRSQIQHLCIQTWIQTRRSLFLYFSAGASRRRGWEPGPWWGLQATWIWKKPLLPFCLVLSSLLSSSRVPPFERHIGLESNLHDRPAATCTSVNLLLSLCQRAYT